MNKSKNKLYSDMPVGKLTRVKDFLPSPSSLVLPDETVEVTLPVKKSSLIFFKNQAQKGHVSYQKMMKELLDRYASHYLAVRPTRSI